MATFKKQLTRFKFETLLGGEMWKNVRAGGRVRQTENGQHRTWIGPSKERGDNDCLGGSCFVFVFKFGDS